MADDDVFAFLDVSQTTSDSSLGVQGGAPGGFQPSPGDPRGAAVTAYVVHPGPTGMPVNAAPPSGLHIPIGAAKVFGPQPPKSRLDSSVERQRGIPRSPCTSAETETAQQSTAWRGPAPPSKGGQPWASHPPPIGGGPGRSSSPVNRGESKAKPSTLASTQSPSLLSGPNSQPVDLPAPLLTSTGNHDFQTVSSPMSIMRQIPYVAVRDPRQQKDHVHPQAMPDRQLILACAPSPIGKYQPLPIGIAWTSSSSRRKRSRKLWNIDFVECVSAQMPRSLLQVLLLSSKQIR